MSNYTSVFAIILKLRMCLCHHSLALQGDALAALLKDGDAKPEAGANPNGES